jgi:LPXTG-motif cell wall-anchored protein
LLSHVGQAKNWHFDLSLIWYNASQYQDNKKKKPAGFSLYTTGNETDYTPQNDLQVGNFTKSSGLKFNVKHLDLQNAVSLSNQTCPIEVSGNVSAHTWFERGGQWYASVDAAKAYQGVGISISTQDQDHHKLGNNFTITVTKPATTKDDGMTFEFVGAESVQEQLQKLIVGSDTKSILTDQVVGENYSISYQSKIVQPKVTVHETQKDDNTVTYTVEIDKPYKGFMTNSNNNAYSNITLIRWKPNDSTALLPPASVTDPSTDIFSYKDVSNNKWLGGYHIKDTKVEDYLNSHPWAVKVANDSGFNMDSKAGYWIGMFSNAVPQNKGYVKGNFYVFVNQVIHFVDEQGNQMKDDKGNDLPDKTTNLTFTSENDDFSSQRGSFDNINLPEVDGYEAHAGIKDSNGELQIINGKASFNEKIITEYGAENFNVPHSDFIEYVVYVKKTKPDLKRGSVTIHYIDLGLNPQGTNFKPEDGKELSDQKQEYSDEEGKEYTNSLWDYQKAGYELATDTVDPLATSGKITNDHQDVYVYLKHKTKTYIQHFTAIEKINYVCANGQHKGEQAADPYTHTIKYSRSQTTDLKENKTITTAWTPDQADDHFVDVKSPEAKFEGYYLGDKHQSKIEAPQLKESDFPDNNNEEPKTFEYTVDYYIDGSVTIHYIDLGLNPKEISLKNGNELTKHAQSYTGRSDKEYQNTLWNYGAAGYELATDTVDPLAEKGTIPNGHQDVYVYLKHQTEKKTENFSAVETITYKYANGPHKGEQAATPYTHTINYSRSRTFDKATGKAISNWTAWEPVEPFDPFVDVKSPEIDGYYLVHDDQSTIKAPQLTNADYQNGQKSFNYEVDYLKDGIVTIYYVDLGLNPQEATTYQPTDGEILSSHTQGYTGKEGATYQNILWDYSAAGYELAASVDPLAENGTFTDTPQNIYVYLKHHIKGEVQNFTATETIIYKYANGPHKGEEAAVPYINTIHYSRSRTVDQTTGKTISDWSAWTPIYSNKQFIDVTSPIIDGYHLANGEQVVIPAPQLKNVDYQNGQIKSFNYEVDYLMNENPVQPTEQPSQPTEQPSQPTEQPTQPTEQPSQPTEQPSQPTEQPTQPTEQPSQPTEQPSQPTEQPSQPTEQPTQPTEQPSQPTEQPSQPTEQPSQPTEQPSQPTEQPSQPTEQPSQPTEQPTQPTEQPSQPTEQPSQPTEQPSQPTEQPTQPTEQPSQPTEQPSQPTEQPSQPTEQPSQPTTPQPTNPTQPVQLTEPVQPTQPQNQPSSSQEINIDTPNKQDKQVADHQAQLPQTGSESNKGILAIGLGALMASLGLGIGKKKKI